MNVSNLEKQQNIDPKPVVHRNRWVWGRSHVILILGGRGMVTVQVDDSDRSTGTISGLSVVPRIRKQGIGKHLLELAENEARKMGCTKVRLFTAEKGFCADWYQRCGYTLLPVKVHPIEWGGGICHLEKDL